MGNLQGDSPDDGYFYMDLAPLGISFPFMGRAEHELYISANGCELARDFFASAPCRPRLRRAFVAHRHFLRGPADRGQRPGQQPRDDRHSVGGGQAGRRNLRLLDR